MPLPVHPTRQRAVVSSSNRARRASLVERLEQRALFAAVAAVSPADLGIGVAVNAHVSIKFSSAMQRASLTSTTLDLRQNTTSLPARISYNANSFTATIDSTAPLNYSSTYNVVVKSGAGGVIDSGSGTLASDYTFSFTTAADPSNGPGGPILVITKATNPYNSYYAEILRAEGLNEFATARMSTVTATSLLSYKVVILGEMTLTAAQATMINNWVTNDGGKLIAMRPDAQLAGLLGLTVTGATINDTYLSIDPSTSIGGGITSDSMQYHSTADRYTLSGATKLADLFSNSTTATGNPAVTIKNVGANGGQAAAFVFDLAKSVVQTRQGNPAWAGQERDGSSPIRSDDLFFGGGIAPDWVDLMKVQIPQADEQQRLLANMINQMTAATMPMPKFWYFPNGKKAVVNMTGDDHLNGGTAYRWSAYLSLGNSGGQPILGTSYMYAGPGAITDSTAAFYQAVGFDPELHVDVSDASDVPRNWTSYADLDSFYASEWAAYTSFYTSIPTPTTNRTHAVVWSDYDTQPQVEFAHRMRLDVNYYYWPGSWVANRPGMFTGSGMPMRFAKLDGTLIDVYQAATQITDENGATEPYHINTLLDNATGSKGYYGAFTINAHTDLPNSTVSDAVIASAQAHDIPVMTAEDLMEWTDARNGSSFSNHAYNSTTHVLTFNISTAAGAAGLQAMVPLVADNNRNVSAISVNGSPVTYNIQTIKGVGYAFFSASAGAVSVTYSADTTLPAVTGKTPAASATNVSILAHPTITMSEDVNPATATFTLTDSLTNAVSGAVSYVAGTHTFTLTPNSNLTAGGTYTLKLTGAQDLAGNAMAGTTTWTFMVAGTGPFSMWDNSAVPQMPYFADGSIEVGVKFQADYDGFITGVRFYKASQNNGTHIGSLYSTAGFSLAEATFTSESASGWQTVTFASPIAINANTTYIAAYHSDTGYAADPSYFDRQFDSLYLHAVADAASGGNGLYRYTPTPLMPNSSFHATNYWVDVVYQLSTTDTTPPTITSTNPANNVTGVPVSTTVSAVFSEPVQSGTISFVLKDPGNNVVAGSTSYNSGTRTVTFTPTSALSGSTVYTATISGAQDTAGNPMAAPVSWAFGTADTTPPTVTSHTPPTNATAVAVNTTVTATFSEAVQSGTIVFTLKDPGNNTVAGSTSYNTSTHVATFTPTASLSDVTVYTASVSGAQDVSGNAMTAPMTWSFTTTDSTAPTVTSHTPATNATNVAINTTVTATFSEAVQSGTISFVLKDAGNNTVAGTTSYNTSTHVATFTPTAALSQLATYTATVSGAQDTTGNPMSAPVSWSFTTADTTPPTVTSHAPLTNATNVAINTTVTATFSEAVQSGTISFTLKDAGNNNVAGTVSYNTSTHIATFTPTASLSDVTVYTATVSGAQDVSGNPMSAPVTWSFTTTDTTAPTVTSHTPATNATNVPINTTVTATFSEAVQSGTISLVLKDAGNNTVAGTTGYNTSTHVATFTPTAALSQLATYTATVSGAQDATGNPMSAPVTWSFTTADTTPPTVTSHTPLTGATNVAVNSTVTATFSEAVQSGTIICTLKDPQNNSVAGTSSYNSGTRVVTFTPSASLVGSTVYTATVSGAQDLAGNPMAAPVSWTFTTVDNIPPTVTAKSPAAGATNVALSATVSATFSEDVQSGTISFVLKDAANNTVAGSVAYNTTTHIATFTPTAALAELTTYTATVSGAQDVSGNPMSAPVTWSFTMLDASAPTVIAQSPLANATNVPVNTTVTATFSEAVQSGTIVFTLKDAANNNVAGTVSYNTSTHVATFTPTASLSDVTVYTATVSGAQDVSGNPMSAPVSWSFTTTDTTAPTVTSHTPLTNATAVPVNTTVTATFSEAVQSGTISFVLKDAGNNNVAGSVSYNGTSHVATFTPTVVLSDVSTYTATVSNAQDATGNPMSAPVTWSFTTADSTAPTVTSHAPLTGATNVSVSSTVTATFSEAVQSGTIAFTLKDAGNNDVAGTVGYDTGTHVATFTPTSPLAGSTSYTAAVSGAQDSSGNAMAAPVSWSFTTIDNMPPTVTGHTPLSNAVNVPVGSTVAATFDEAVQAGTITFTLKDAGNNDVAGTVSYNSGTHVVTFTPDAPLGGSTTFTASVSGAQDITGNAMAAPVTWSFTTADVTAPTVTAASPLAGATNVPVAATISATFSEAVQSATISFIVKDAGNNVVAGAVSYDGGTHVATFTPTSALVGETTYTATVSAAQDASGNPMAAPQSWSFTTVDNTPPVVSAHSPLSNATNVSAGAVVTATFNEAVQSGTITFTLKDALDQNVSGVVIYDSPTRTATFTPSAPLSGSTTYTATISGAQDLAGNTLAAPATWSFSTADATSPTAAAGSELPAPGTGTFDFTVTYTDAGSLDATTFDDNDITVTGPSGSANATFISVDTAGNGSPRIVTYRITAPGGLWNVLDNGTYTISLNADQVKDSSNNAVAAGSIRTFNPALPFAYQTGTTVHADFYGSIPGITLDATVGDITASDGTTTLSFSSVTSVIVTGTANADTLNFNGPVTPSIAFNGGAGADVLNVDAGTYTFSADAVLTSPNLTINVNAGQVFFNATQHLNSLNIAGGARATVSANGDRVLTANTLSIANLGTLDLNDNDLVVSGGNFSTLQALILGGYRSGPDSSATGIISTTSQTVHDGTTILALFDNSLGGFADYPFGSGNSIAAGAIVGKYTYIGDTNFDGQVTPQDYTATDSNLGTSVEPGISWFYGDTNFDGNIDATDYAGIDGALGLGVGNPLAVLIARPTTPFSGLFSRKLIETLTLDEV
jgi:methionine-rich copper-binding protein CopC